MTTTSIYINYTESFVKCKEQGRPSYLSHEKLLSFKHPFSRTKLVSFLPTRWRQNFLTGTSNTANHSDFISNKVTLACIYVFKMGPLKALASCKTRDRAFDLLKYLKHINNILAMKLNFCWWRISEANWSFKMHRLKIPFEQQQPQWTTSYMKLMVLYRAPVVAHETHPCCILCISLRLLSVNSCRKKWL